MLVVEVAQEIALQQVVQVVQVAVAQEATLVLMQPLVQQTLAAVAAVQWVRLLDQAVQA
jgi:hypothetical protein